MQARLRLARPRAIAAADTPSTRCHWTFVAPNRRLTAAWATRGGATQLWRGWSRGVVQVRAMYACVLVNIGVCGAGDNQIQQRHYYSAKARTFPAAQSAQWRLQRRAHRTCAQSTVHGLIPRRGGCAGRPRGKAPRGAGPRAVAARRLILVSKVSKRICHSERLSQRQRRPVVRATPGQG